MLNQRPALLLILAVLVAPGAASALDPFDITDPTPRPVRIDFDHDIMDPSAPRLLDGATAILVLGTDLAPHGVRRSIHGSE